jgi:hypothetical protein
MTAKAIKPLGGRAYGSIGHLPCSRLGPADHCLNDGQCRILTEKSRDKHDTIIVTEKLDGTCVAVYRDPSDQLIPLMRAGYHAMASNFVQHHLFARWVEENRSIFHTLECGERVVGEWLAQAHGTRYDLTNRSPFVAFDLFNSEGDRATQDELRGRFLFTPKVLHCGGSCSVATAMEALGMYGHYGAIDEAEGAVWRVERKGKVDFLGKYVRPNKVDGKYLPEISGRETIWNWRSE